MRITGNVFLVKRKRGDKWYVQIRTPDPERRGRMKQTKRLLGPSWAERGRPRRVAQDWRATKSASAPTAARRSRRSRRCDLTDRAAFAQRESGAPRTRASRCRSRALTRRQGRAAGAPHRQRPGSRTFGGNEPHFAKVFAGDPATAALAAGCRWPWHAGGAQLAHNSARRLWAIVHRAPVCSRPQLS
jgi:hypothetical protein